MKTQRAPSLRSGFRLRAPATLTPASRLNLDLSSLALLVRTALGMTDENPKGSLAALGMTARKKARIVSSRAERKRGRGTLRFRTTGLPSPARPPEFFAARQALHPALVHRRALPQPPRVLLYRQICRWLRGVPGRNRQC